MNRIDHVGGAEWRNPKPYLNDPCHRGPDHRKEVHDQPGEEPEQRQAPKHMPPAQRDEAGIPAADRGGIHGWKRVRGRGGMEEGNGVGLPRDQRATRVLPQAQPVRGKAATNNFMLSG